MKTVKYAKIPKSTLVGIVVLIVAIAFAATVLFAYFSADLNIKGDVSSRTEINVEVSGDNGLGLVFAAPGDTYRANVTVKNPNDFAISYRIKLSGIETSVLKDAIIVKLDGNVIGIYSKIIDEDGFIKTDEKLILAPKLTDTSTLPERIHKLELELHIGAGDGFKAVSNNVLLSVQAETFTDQNYIFVQNEYEFLQAIRPETLKGNTVKTVILSNNISLENYVGNEIAADIYANGDDLVPTASDVVITENLNLDLNGKTLTLNTGLFFYHARTGTSRVGSGFSGGKILFEDKSAATHGMVVSMPNGVMLFGDNQSGYSVEKLEIRMVNDKLLVDEATQTAKTRLSGGISAMVEADFLGGLGVYSALNRLQISVAPQGLSTIKQVGNTATIIAINGFLPENLYQEIIFTSAYTVFETKSITVRLLTENDSIDAIIKENNSYLFPSDDSSPETYVYQLKRDLFLPTRVRSFDATIEWISSDETALTTGGKYVPGMADKIVKLTAIVSYEGNRYQKEFTLNATGLSAEERIKLMCAEESIVFTSSPAVHIFRLNLEKFNLENITFEVAAPTYFELTEELEDGVLKDSIKLKVSPSDNWTSTVKVKAQKTDATGQVMYDVSADIKITVSIARVVSIIDEAHRHAQTFFSHIDRNTFLNFALPSHYNSTVNISYVLSPVVFEIGGNSYNNPLDVNSYVTLADKNPTTGNYGIVIDAKKLPMKNTLIYIRAIYSFGGETFERVLSFTLSGIYRNSENQIADFSLYVKLLNAVDKNNDLYITYDEATQTDITALSLKNSGISNLKGIEYFHLTGSLDLRNNKLYDLQYLSAMYDLKSVDLSFNNISSITALSNCISLTYLNLSNNIGLSEVTALSLLKNIETLNLANCTALRDVSSIRDMNNLKTLYVYGTSVATYLLNSRNAILTAYYNYYDRYKVYPSYYITSNTQESSFVEATYRASNNAINSIQPIYEFANVIYLPPTADGYALTWTCEPSGIVEFKDNYAYVLQPLADVNARLTASLKALNNDVINRQFPVLSRADSQAQYLIETELGKYTAADKIIPDSNLRYLLFKTFDTNNDKYIKIAEIAAFGGTNLSWDNKNIASLQGLEYFTTIRDINLSNNPFGDIAPLNTLMLTNLILINCMADLSKLSPISDAAKFATLNVFGSVRLDDDAVLKALVHIFANHMTSNGSMFKNSTATKWDPYEYEVKRALSTVTGAIVVKAGQPAVDLSEYTKLNWSLYGEAVTFNVNFNNYSSPPNSWVYTLASNKVSLLYQNAPSVDVMAMMTVRISYNSVTYNAIKMIYLQANTELMVETLDGASVPLHIAVTDSYARQQIINQLGEKAHANGEVITRAMLTEITSLTFACDSPYGLSGVRLFAGLNLKGVNVLYGAEFYKDKDGNKEYLLKPLEDVSETLETLNITKSFVNLTILQKMPMLKSLTMQYCPKIVMETAMINVFDQFSAAAVFPKLTNLSMADNYITSAASLLKLKYVSELKLYNNPCSAAAVTEIIINKVYENLINASETTITQDDYHYYITSQTVLWRPNFSIGATVKDAGAKLSSGAAVSPEIFGVNMVAHGDTLILPSAVTLNGVTYMVRWKTLFTSTIILASGTATFENRHDAAAYVVLEAELPLLQKSILYYFVVAGTAELNDRANFVNLELFQTVDGAKTVVADPYFLYYCYQKLQAVGANTTGLYEKTIAETITSFDFSNTRDVRKYNVSNIRGIENFTALKSIKLSYNAIKDLSPIKDLSALTEIDITGNEVSSMWLANGDSVFKKMTALSTLRVAFNYNIDDFLPISYATKNSSTLRSGLANLKTLFIFDILEELIPVPSSDYDSANWVKAIHPWLDSVKSGGAFTGVSLAINDTWNADGSHLSKILDSASILINLVPDKYMIANVDGQYIAVNLDADDNNIGIVISGVGVYNENYFVSYESIGSTMITFANNKITLSTTSGIAGQLKIRVNVQFNTTDKYVRVYKDMVLDTSMLNSSVVPSIQVTEKEKSAYLQAQPGLSFTSLSADVWQIDAEKLMPDYAFQRYMFEQFDTDNNRILTTLERAVGKQLQITGYLFVYSIEGLELFPKVTSLTLSGNRITKIPQFVKLPYASEANLSLTITENYLTDLSGLLTLGTNGSRITRLTIDSSGALGQENAQYIKNLPLTYLKIVGTDFYDYNFLAEALPKTLQQLVVEKSSTSIGFTSFYNFSDVFTKVLFETKGSGGGGLLTTGNTLLSSYVNFDPITEVFSPFLSKSSELEKGKTVELDKTFTAFGKTYGVRYALPSGVTNVTLSGYNITVAQGYTADMVTLNVVCYVLDDSGNELYATYRQNTTFPLSVTSGADVVYLPTEGYIYDSSAADGKVLFSSVVPDIGLRMILLSLFDSNADGSLSQTEMAVVKTGTVALQMPVGNAGAFANPIPVSSYEGIGRFASIFAGKLELFGVNTADLSPLGELKKVTGLTFRTSYIYVTAVNPRPAFTDYSFVSQMTSLVTLGFEHNNYGFGMEEIFMDSKTLQTVTSNGMNLYASLLNAIAYGQSKNNVSDYPTSNIIGGTRNDQKLAALVLSALDIKSFMRADSNYYLNNLKPEESYTLPSQITYQSDVYNVTYLPLTSNIALSKNTDNSYTIKAKGIQNYTKAKFLARITINGALYERMLEFKIDNA